MHNIKDLRKNLDYYKKKLLNRNYNLDTNEFENLDKDNRNLISKKEKLEQEKKILSKSKDQSNFQKSKKISEEISKLNKDQIINKKKLDSILHTLPNLPLDDVPIGKDDKSNKIIKKFGKIRDFNFIPKSHVEICSSELDFDTSTKLSGSRFVVLKNKLALLERALINFMLDVHTIQFKYTEVSPPLIVNEDVIFGTGQLPKF